MQSLGALFVIRLITLLNIVDDLRGHDASQCLCDVDTKYIRPTHTWKICMISFRCGNMRLFRLKRAYEILNMVLQH